MSEGLFENRGDAPGQAPHWDHPDGLGWHLWRRAHSTGLLAQPIQRDLGRLRSHTLIDRAPLADDIRRRWGLGQEPAGYRFPLDLPLFYTRFPRYDASPSEAQPASTVQLLRRSTDVPSLSVLSRRLPLSEGLGLSQTMQLERLVSRSDGIDIALARHGRDLPNPGQTPRLLWHRQEARTPGVAPAVATDNNVRASAQAGPRTVGGTQQFAQRLVQRNTLASDSIYALSDLKTFTLTATASPSPGRVQDGALIPHRAMRVLRAALPWPVWPGAFSADASPMPRSHPGPEWPRSGQVAPPPTLQRRVELALPAWPLERRRGPLAAPYGLPDEPFARLRPQVSREVARTAPGFESSGARPTSWVALPFQAPGRGDTPNAAGATFPQVAEVSVQRRASLVTQPVSLVTQHGIGASDMRLGRSQTGLNDMGTAASLPLGLTNPGAAPEAALLAQNIPWKHLAGSHNTAAIADHGTLQRRMGVEGRTGLLRRSNTREETSGHSGGMVTTDLMWRRRTSGAVATGRPLLSDASQVAEISVSRQENPVLLQRDAGTPPASWTRSQSRVDNMGIVASMPLLLTPLAAGTPVGMLSRTPFWKHHAGGPNPAPTAFTVTRQRAIDFGELHRPLYWSGALQAPDQHGVGRGGGGLWQTLASGTASTIEPSDRQIQRRATGARHATFGSNALPGQGWTLPLQAGPTLHRQPYARNATLHGSYGRMGTRVRDRAGDSEASIGVMSLGPSYHGRETRLQRSHNVPRVLLHVPTAGPLAPIGDLYARTATGAMSLPTLAFRTGQRATVPPSEPSANIGSVHSSEELRSFSPAVRGGGSWVPESNSTAGIGHWRLLRHTADSLGGAFDKRQLSIQRHGANWSVPLIDTTWGEARTAVVDDRSTRAGTSWALRPAESVPPVWSRAAAVREDSQSGLSVRSSPALTRAWASTPAAPPLFRHFHNRTEPGEHASSVVRRRAEPDLPLAFLLGTETWDHAISRRSTSSPVLQTSPQSPIPTPASAIPIGSGEETAPAVAQTSASQAQMDVDELAEQVWQKLMHKMTIEQERRGYTRWL
jgi:hypothetical protein